MPNTDGYPNLVLRRLAILLTIIGLLFAVDSVFALSLVHKLWPLLLTTFAVGLLGIFKRTKPRGGLYLAAGTFLFCFSALALYCNFAGWSKLAQMWPLFIAFLGVAFVAHVLYCKRKRFHLLLGLLLLSLSLVFFLVLSLGAQYWWAAFILAGLSIWIAEKAS